jgi:hypothetical protein
MVNQSKGATTIPSSAADTAAASGPSPSHSVTNAHVSVKTGEVAAKLGPPASTTAAPIADAKVYSLLGIEFSPAKSEIEAHVNPWIAGVLVVAILASLLIRRGWRRRLKSFEIEKAELGIGAGKITLKPNDTDRQVAYQIWVELSTRKIGLPIDLNNDVVAEIYDSWHNFFGVTRELIKSVPVSRAADDNTRKIINLSIEVLNDGLRPHLTLWQARFRAWYDRQVKDRTDAQMDPQDIQSGFPRFQELSADLINVNQNLIAYRALMGRIVYEH